MSSLSPAPARSRGYLVYLIIFMGLVAVMDQYISTIKTTAIPSIIKEYGITAANFSWWEALYLIPTFFIFLLNGLNDLIGRRWAILILILMMGCSCLAIVFFTPGLHLFMAFYAMAMFTTVSNMWTIPISEESPALKRAKYVAITYVIGLLPLQALLPPLLINTLGLSWKWMYGVMFALMLPVLILWLFMQETHRHQAVRAEQRAGLRRRHFFGLGAINRRDARYIALSAAIWICWLVNSLLYFWGGYYFMTVRGFSFAQWNLVLLGTLLMAMTGGVASGWIMDRVGRRTGLIIGCLGLAVTLGIWGVVPRALLPVVAALTGFFISAAYTWIVVYVPEVFPTERRGACMGWTTTVARIAYVAGPALAAVLLQANPTMEWFWVVAGAIMVLPVIIILLFNPYETKLQELEDIETRR